MRSTPPPTGSDPGEMFFDTATKASAGFAPGTRPASIDPGMRSRSTCLAAQTLRMHASTLTPHEPLTAAGPTLPRLYTFRRCPYAMRARMALLQAGRAFEAVEVNLRGKPASLLALSPKATVSVLQLPDGRVIEESWDIMRWALAAPDAQGWWARAQSPANIDLLERNDGDFKHDLDRWKYPSATPVRPSRQTHTATRRWMCFCDRWRHGCSANPAWAAPRHAPPTWPCCPSSASSPQWSQHGLQRWTCHRYGPG